MPDREKVIKGLECCIKRNPDDKTRCGECPYEGACLNRLKLDALTLLKKQEPITGETSDGYHTFNELYHHRAVLFSVVVANYKDRAWKSVRHHDGTMYDGMFIVGIDTPDGQATYHYDIDPYWDMFDCKVREFAPEWDGHTPAQAIERIGKLTAQEPREMSDVELMDAIRKAPIIVKPAVDAAPVVHGRWEPTTHGFPPEPTTVCSNCGLDIDYEICKRIKADSFSYTSIRPNYCPHCGAKMDKED